MYLKEELINDTNKIFDSIVQEGKLYGLNDYYSKLDIYSNLSDKDQEYINYNLTSYLKIFNDKNCYKYRIYIEIKFLSNNNYKKNYCVSISEFENYQYYDSESKVYHRRPIDIELISKDNDEYKYSIGRFNTIKDCIDFFTKFMLNNRL